MTDLARALAEAEAELERIAADKAEAARAMQKALRILFARRVALTSGRPEVCSFAQAESAQSLFNLAAGGFNRLAQQDENIRAAMRGHQARVVPKLPTISRLRPMPFAAPQPSIWN